MLFPKLYFEDITFITPEVLAEHGIKGLLIDVDNTLSPYGNVSISESVRAHIKMLRQCGFKMILLSNNFNKRVSQASKLLELSHVSFGIKPLPFGYIKAKKLLQLNRKEIAVVGDQIFTDILGANLLGIFSVLVEPLDKGHEGITLRIRRAFEKHILKIYHKRNREDIS